MTHKDCITHISNQEDQVYLKCKHFPVNMRLFHTSPKYKELILDSCEYIKSLCLDTKDGYKKPHGMSSANAGLAFNIIGVTMNRNRVNEYCEIFINPTILEYSGELVESMSNCGSLTLDEPIKIKRRSEVIISYYDTKGEYHVKLFDRSEGGLTIQHEIDHNNGVLITDRV